ncbi:MAG: HesA/MoeB/ThiF family protein [Nitrososphaerota archaeon]|nr:HesA/MoeB/ThiF family protein [Nitrososphaerota archaeon]
MSLSDIEIDRYSRQIVLDEIGYKGQLRLKEAKVCVIGLGGLGSHITQQLAGMGIGFLRIVDQDVVDLSNLHRQSIYTMDSIGYAKVEAASNIIHRINPNVRVEPLPLVVNYRTAERIVSGMDVVIDGLDSIEARYAINNACVKHKIPYVYGAAIRTLAAASTIIPYETPCLKCIFPNLHDGDLPKCAIVGVHPSVVSLIASIEVSEAIKLILGQKPSLAGSLLLCDLKDLTFDKVSIKRDTKCSVCGNEGILEPIPPITTVMETCGRSGMRVFIIAPKEVLNLDLNKLINQLNSDGYKINVKGKLSITFTYNEDTVISIHNTGVSIINTTLSQQESIDTLKQIFKKGLNIDLEQFLR